MGQAVRAIIIENEQMLVMKRNKYGSEYYTLVGGRVNDGESLENALIREIKEETGLTITAARLVFTEKHPEPYNDQYIFHCEVAPHQGVALATDAEENFLNKLQTNIHTPMWVNTRTLATVPFRTPQLHKAIMDSLVHGFPHAPMAL